MTLIENIKIVLSLIDEYSPNSTNLFTEDEDIENKIKILYMQPYQELSQLKKIKKTKKIVKTNNDANYYREYSLPKMFIFRNVIVQDNETNELIEGDYYLDLHSKKIYINDSSDATYTIEYYSYPTVIDANTEDDFELELDQDVQMVLPYKVADNILKSDPSADYTAFRQAYEESLNKLDTREQNLTITIESEYDF